MSLCLLWSLKWGSLKAEYFTKSVVGTFCGVFFYAVSSQKITFSFEWTLTGRKTPSYLLESTFFIDVRQVNGCSMKRLDPRILDLRHLQTLNLANNLLTTLPDNPGRWTCLTELDMSSNQLTTVPSVLFRTRLKSSLSVLKLNKNSLQSLPPQLCEISGLVQLHVDDNKLTALPPTIGE